MKRASGFFSEAEKAEVAQAVAEAEKGTSGEIVPVVATASGRYDRAEDIFGVLLALFAVGLAWALFQNVQGARGDWASGHATTLGLLPILGIFVGGFIVGSAAATYLPVLKLPFVRRAEMREEVARCAEAAFHRYRVNKTKGGTGIIIYISLFEHMVVVLGDDAVAAHLERSDWDGVRDLVLQGIRDGRPGDGLCQGIRKCGELLGRHFPVRPDDVNELTNELRTID